MRFMNKRVLSFLVAALLALSLCACSPAPSSAGGTPASDPSDSAPSSSSQPQTPAGEEITLQFWEMNYGSDDRYLETCEKLIQQYEAENPGVKVEITLQPWDNYYQLFLTAVTSNAAPDVASVALDMPDMYAQMGEALSLDPVIDAWTQDGSISDYNEAMMKAFVHENSQIAIPYMVGYRGIFYRADYLRECGVEKVPETWDELLAACEKIREKRPDLVPLDFAGAEPGSWHYFICFAMSNDAGILDRDGAPGSTTDAYKQTIDLFRTFKEKGYVADGVLGHKSADAEKLYYSGDAVFWFTSFPTSIFDYPEVMENTQVASAMRGPSGTATRTASFSDALMVFSQTEHPDEARKFVKWWAENTDALFSEGGCWAYPARSSFFSVDTFNNKIAQGVLNVVLPTAVPCTWPSETIFPGFSQINGERIMDYSMQESLNAATETDVIAQNQADKIAEALELALDE